MLKQNSKCTMFSERLTTTFKTTHFDEDNLIETYHPKRKDYGFMSINESKTPYPRKEDPVDAHILRDRIQQTLAKANRFASVFEFGSEISLQTLDTLTPSQHQQWRMKSLENSFAVKRAKSEYGEFTLTRQRFLSMEIHNPLQSVGRRSQTRMSDAPVQFDYNGARRLGSQDVTASSR